MSRKDEFKNQNQNPSKFFLEWKSNEKTFQYYNKETKEKVNMTLPFKFLTLKEMHTVKGWNDSSESAIYSNEVKYIGSDPLSVKSFKGGELANGLYKDIRTRIKDCGGHYVKSVYIMMESGDIYNLQLKGSAVQAWGDFTKKTRLRLADEWVEVVKAQEKTKGSIKYSVPVFEFNQSLSENDGMKADEVYHILDMYMDTYLAGKAVKVEDNEPEQPPIENIDEDNEPDDLPF